MEQYIEQLFLQILKLSVSAAALILIAAFLRLLLKKAPKGIICIMWYMVCLRLILPFNIESAFGLAPNMDVVAQYLEGWAADGVTESVNSNGIAAPSELHPAGASSEPYPADASLAAYSEGTSPELELYPNSVSSGLYSDDASLAAYSKGTSPELYPDGASPEPDSAGKSSGLQMGNKAAFWLRAGSLVWLGGLFLMFGYMLFSYAMLRKKLRTAVLYKENIRQSEFVDSPFIFGIIRSGIYIPYGLEGDALRHVLAHEKAHLARKDHIVKFVAFIILGIHWFNPLVWLAYALFCKDIEAACDEKTIAYMEEEERMSYAMTLLSVGGRARVFDICPIGFGELGVKERVLRIKGYKKPALRLVLGALFICVPAALCFCISPKQVVKARELPVSFYYYADYWTIYDMSETIFPDKESLEAYTVKYLKAAGEFLGCEDWWEELNPEADELQLTYYMQDSRFCKTGFPAPMGKAAIAASITLSRNTLQNGGLFCEDSGLIHEFGHLFFANSFSLSLEDGMCEYINNQISPYSLRNHMQIPFQDFFCIDLKEGLEKYRVEQAELDKWLALVGREGREYPYMEGGSDSEIWYCMSHSFVNYLVDTYGISDVVELLREGESEADYEKYLGHSLEELKEDWWSYVTTYESELTLESIWQKMSGN